MNLQAASWLRRGGDEPIGHPLGKALHTQRGRGLSLAQRPVGVNRVAGV
jgi:hypothetical protein